MLAVFHRGVWLHLVGRLAGRALPVQQRLQRLQLRRGHWGHRLPGQLRLSRHRSHVRELLQHQDPQEGRHSRHGLLRPVGLHVGGVLLLPVRRLAQVGHAQRRLRAEQHPCGHRLQLLLRLRLGGLRVLCLPPLPAGGRRPLRAQLRGGPQRPGRGHPLHGGLPGGHGRRLPGAPLLHQGRPRHGGRQLPGARLLGPPSRPIPSERTPPGEPVAPGRLPSARFLRVTPPDRSAGTTPRDRAPYLEGDPTGLLPQNPGGPLFRGIISVWQIVATGFSFTLDRVRRMCEVVRRLFSRETTSRGNTPQFRVASGFPISYV